MIYYNYLLRIIYQNCTTTKNNIYTKSLHDYYYGNHILQERNTICESSSNNISCVRNVPLPERAPANEALTKIFI